MGTRADFYVGKGKAAEWIGSIAYDGYRGGIAVDVLEAKTATNFRNAVEAFLGDRDDASRPSQGWPWPWNDSGITDCSYWFYDGQCWEAYGYPHEYMVPCDKEMPSEDVIGEDKFREWLFAHERAEFPDMSSQRNVTFGQRSGLLIIGVK